MNTHDHAFDAALRAHHQAALTQLSPQVQAQLVQRRRAALRGEHAGTGRQQTHRLRFAAAGIAAAALLAIGLQLQTPTGMLPAAPAQLASHGPAAAPASPQAGTASASTLLDEDPEFYAWLTSPDVQRVAME